MSSSQIKYQNNADLLFDAKGSSFRVYSPKSDYQTFYLEVRGRLRNGARQKKNNLWQVGD